MTADQQDDLIGQLSKDMPLWADSEELAEGHFADRTHAWWMEALGHPKAHPGCCKTCGCATTCLAEAFYDAVVASVVRELDKLGALRDPASRGDQ